MGDIFTQINEEVVFNDIARYNFSYVFDLGDGKLRQSYLFTGDELVNFRNELRKILEKR